MKPNPYTCRLLRRLDYLIYKLKRKQPHWSERTGHLIVGNGEARTFFPGKFYIVAAQLQNKWFWTRRVLSV